MSARVTTIADIRARLTAPARRSTALSVALRRAPLGTYAQGRACPACAGGAWHIGRSTAECSGCGFVLPLASPGLGEG